MKQNKATATLAVIVVVASLMVGATIAIALVSEGIGIQQANAAKRAKILPLCQEQTPKGPTSTPPCGGSG
jgi:hypothetical protein